MKVWIIGPRAQREECKHKLGPEFLYFESDDWNSAHYIACDVAFDFGIGENQQRLTHYDQRVPVFLNTVLTGLLGLPHASTATLGANFFGFNGMHGFFNRPLLELTLHPSSDEAWLAATCKKLNTAYEIVADRVGMATPRVICMIINEAYYTVQEGTATRADIDLAMKLGTNYPFGPFEWAQRIGLKNVYRLLEAVYHDTHDERYKICPLLKQEASLPGLPHVQH
jgi:3-hydroxybutyryl-CoA dehydrogenase